MQKYTVIADPRVKDDLKEAQTYLNRQRNGYGKKRYYNINCVS